jgi:hypothetical protein
MQDTMESQSKGHNEPPGEDLSALAWVHGELRRALENAHKSLRRYLKEAESLGARMSTWWTPRCCAARATRSTRVWARSNW